MSLSDWIRHAFDLGWVCIRSHTRGGGHEAHDLHAQSPARPTLEECLAWAEAGGNVEVLLHESDLFQVDAERGAPAPWSDPAAHKGACLSRSAGGGLHAVYARPDGVEARRWIKPVPDIDLLSKGAWPLPGCHRDGDEHKAPGEWAELAPPCVPVCAPQWVVDSIPKPAPRPSARATPRAGAAQSRRAAVALAAEIEAAESAAEGQSHVLLHRAACNLGQLVAVGELDESEVRAGLETAAHRRQPHQIEEAMRAIEDGLAWGKAHPREDAPRSQSMPDAASERLSDASANGNGEAKPKTLPYRRVFELERLRPENDIVRGLLGPRELVLLWGEPSGGKTMTGVALCGSIATGEPFLEHEVQHPGSVVYVCGEGLAGLRNRFDAWAHGLDDETRRAVAERVYVVTAAPNLLDQDQAAALVRTVEAIHKESGPVCLVVLDTLASLTPGSDENKQDSGTAVIALARDIAEKADGASVLAIHHAKKDGSEYRGSSTLGGGFDVILKTVKTGAGFELHVRKQKDREVPPDGWAFKAEVVTLDEGTDPNGADTVRSVRVGSVQRADGKIDRDVGLETTLGRVADALVAAGHPGADALRRSIDLGVVLLLDAGPKRFGEIVAACKGLTGELGSAKAVRSKLGRVLKRMSNEGYLTESGAKHGRTYSLADPGRKAFSGALDALKNLPTEEPPW